MKTIRDFLYVDRDKLYSIYSQVHEGVVDQIVSSFAAEKRAESTQASPLRQAKIEEQVAEASSRTENKSLYDFMYSSLEDKLATSIIDLTTAEAATYREQISHAALLKTRGRAEIEDFERFESIAEKFNDLGTLIAYGILQIQEKNTTAAAAVAEAIKTEKDGNKRTRLEIQGKVAASERKRKASEIAKAGSLYQDEEQLSLLRMVAKLFNPGGYEVTILPSGTDGSIVFRGILDKRHLRVSPNLIRALYGGTTTSEWTMVGQVTFIPWLPRPAQPIAPPVSSAEVVSMRDPFRKLIGSMRAFEEMFMQSKERSEVLLSPIALYRDITITDDLQPALALGD